MKIWVNGEIVEADARVAQASDRGLLLGDGLFETIKIDRGRAVFLTEHLCRLQVSARELNLPVERDTLRAGLLDLMDKTDEEVGAARITVTRGPGPRGLLPIPVEDQSPTIVISLSPATAQHFNPEPDRLLPAPFIRSSGAPTSRMKTLSYTDNLAARAFAAEQAAADVVFTNEFGDVASTSMANLFVETDTGLVTPPLTAGILPGIVRAMILRYAARQHVPVTVRRLQPNDLWGRRLYRTNSLIGVRPAWFDGGGWTEGPVNRSNGMIEDLYALAEKEDRGR
ncbi:aminotransferase class IV [Parvularcula sp. LCG005]|uniref:aminotransferase class IV n=1 Tax=Parvularcula sp. LCG005 TaxID=3078805 RepID=UPI00294286B8|nr:aminotransferase class IV [Parvularcula sp. LCG005]WOI53556.1 aminotransferase class IV [Parvularcula sp. LCG005]